MYRFKPLWTGINWNIIFKWKHLWCIPAKKGLPGADRIPNSEEKQHFTWCWIIIIAYKHSMSTRRNTLLIIIRNVATHIKTFIAIKCPI